MHLPFTFVVQSLTIMKIAVVGATGLVGQQMLKVLEEEDFPVDRLIPVASSRSVGKEILYAGRKWEVMAMESAIALQPDIALFSAGGDTALQYGPAFVQAGSYVIDNSSAFRMKEGVPLIVPEVNGHRLTAADKFIANPNCSTIQLVMVLQVIEQLFGLERVVVSTYQSVTGTGYKAVQQLNEERQGQQAIDPAYPYPIDLNCIPQCDVFVENGFTKEEMKLVNETRKILHQPQLLISATAVRIPTVGGHSESVNVDCSTLPDLPALREALRHAPGIVVQDDPDALLYPMPAKVRNKNDVFVGRIRKDLSAPHGLHLWIVADNLRKGAATNTVQIAQYLLAKGWIQ